MSVTTTSAPARASARQSARPPGEQPGGIDVDRHLGQLEADALVLDDRLAKGDTLLGIVEGELIRRPRNADRARRHRGPGMLQHQQRTERAWPGIRIPRLA